MVEPTDKAANTNHFDADRFRSENRIHMKYGSRFTQDHYIVVHPREMRPENENRLAAKLIKHYTIPTISFFNFNPRGQVAAQLATLVPVSYDAKQQSLSKRLLDVYTESKTGQDKEIAELSDKREAPFNAMVRNYLEQADHDPEQREYTTNALCTYLLLNEALSLRGYHKEASSYVRNPVDVDTVLAQLSPLLNVKPNAIVKAASENGLEGLAETLGVSSQKLEEVKQVAAIAEANQYSNNMVENWNVGRAVQGAGNVSVPEKMQAGLMQRVANKLKSLHADIHEQDVPQDIQSREKMFVATLRDLPPELLEALYVSGTEFAFTPDPAIGSLDQQSGRALGFYRPATYDTSHEYGVRQIYVSARQSTEEFRENLMHECHHLIFPKVFTVDQREEIDRLLKDGADYMTGLKDLLDDWYNAPPQMRDKIQAHIQHAYFLPQGVTMEQVLGNMSMTSFRDAVHDAVDNLDPDSLYLAKANYASPELRVAEIISRYAEMKYVRMRDFPDALNFIAPQMNEIYNNHYLPHVRERLDQMKQEQQALPEYMHNMGFPPHAIPKGEVPKTPYLKVTGHPTEMISASSASHASKGLASQADELREGAGKFESKLAEMDVANERMI